MKAKAKQIQVKVPGRGFHMNSGTRVVPHKHLDRRRPKTRQLVEEA